MNLIGTMATPEDQHERISAEGMTYDEARAALDVLVPEGQQLIAIRVER